MLRKWPEDPEKRVLQQNESIEIMEELVENPDSITALEAKMRELKRQQEELNKLMQTMQQSGALPPPEGEGKTSSEEEKSEEEEEGGTEEITSVMDAQNVVKKLNVPIL
jgi:seryl-tRNA synthetase